MEMIDVMVRYGMVWYVGYELVLLVTGLVPFKVFTSLIVNNPKQNRLKVEYTDESRILNSFQLSWPAQKKVSRLVC